MPAGDRHLSIGLSRSELRLGHAFKEMSRQWSETAPYWRDNARKAFEKEYVDELFVAARGAVGSMAEIQRFLSQVIQECS